MMQFIYTLAKAFYGGIDFSSFHNGGIDCYDFISFKQRLAETFMFTLLASFLLSRVIRTLYLPKEWELASMCRKRTSQKIIGFRKFLLVLLTGVFGVEVGFMMVMETCVYIFKPCHIITMVQIYLLAAEPTRLCTGLFRLQIHLLANPFLSCFYSLSDSGAVNTMTYWIQHITIFLIVPPYLIYTGGAFKCESLKDMSWVLLATMLFSFYTFYVLQAVAMMFLVNVDSVLCPTSPDNSFGLYYRIIGMVQQTLLIIVFGKLYTMIIYAFMKINKICRNKQMKEKRGEHYVTTFIEEEKVK